MGARKNVSPENKAMARHVANIVGGSPHVHIYDHDTIDLSIAILSSEDRPVSGVTTYGTLGMSDYPMLLEGREYPTRLELIGACSSEDREFANVVAAAGFCLMRTNRLLGPGSVLREYVAEYFPNSSVPHLYFTAPFLWPTLETTQFGPKTVSWLLAMPIADAEASFLELHGDQALETLFEKQQIDLYDLNRSAVC